MSVSSSIFLKVSHLLTLHYFTLSTLVHRAAFIVTGFADAANGTETRNNIEILIINILFLNIEKHSLAIV